MKYYAKNSSNRGLFVPRSAVLFLLVTVITSVSAQSSPTAHVYQDDPRRSKAENDARRDIHKRRTRLGDMDRLNDIADRYNRAGGKKNRKLTETEQLLLIPTENELIRYSGLSVIPGVKFGKLLNSKCGDGRVDVGSHPACVAQLPGGGASYSFLRGFNDFRRDSDVILEDGSLHAAGFLTTGLFQRLDEIEFQGDRKKMPVLAALESFVPATTEAGYFDLEERLKSGIEKDGRRFTSGVEFEAGNVFAIRSISYRSKLTSDDFRKDTITLIKILEISPDGHVLFAWRSAGKRKGPKLKLDR